MRKAADIQRELDELREKHGPGYAADRAVARYQAHLSVMLETARRIELMENIIERGNHEADT